jgi:hypothetical protein
VAPSSSTPGPKGAQCVSNPRHPWMDLASWPSCGKYHFPFADSTRVAALIVLYGACIPDPRQFRPKTISSPKAYRMKSTLMSVGLLAWLVSLVSATALTYRLGANEKACFYAVSPKENTKMAFYFAVRRLSVPTLQMLRLTCLLLSLGAIRRLV